VPNALCWRLGLVFLCVAVRLLALDADPPPWLSWSTGIYTDEGYYTLDARHEALFGTLAPGNFHDRLLSPLLSVLQQGVFAVFGTGLLQARGLSIAFGLLTIWVFWLALRRAYDVRTADFGALFLGLAPPFALYNQLALQETPTVFWLVLAFALWAQGGRLGAFLSGLSLALACVFKGLALVALPVLLIGPPALQSAPLLRGPILGSQSKKGAASSIPTALFPVWLPRIGAGGLLLLYLALWYWPHHAELSRMAAFYQVHQMQPHSLVSLGLNMRRGLIGGERGVFPYLLALVPVPCLLAARILGQWRQWKQADQYLALWLGCGLLFCLLSSYAPSRYYVLFLPPLAGLAAQALVNLRRAARLAAVGLFLLTSSVWLGVAWVNRSDARLEAGRTLNRLLPPGSVIVGEFAPALCLGTPFRAAPVQPGLSNDDRPIERLNAAAIAVTRTAFWEQWWQSRYPAIVQPSHRIATFTLGGSRRYIVDVYRIK